MEDMKPANYICFDSLVLYITSVFASGWYWSQISFGKGLYSWLRILPCDPANLLTLLFLFSCLVRLLLIWFVVR